MDVLGSTGQVELSLSRTQLDEERQVRALASGLRVVSAADDPSGLAISQNIQAQVLGLQQGIQNVQTANNLLDVADATLANVQTVLQKIHGLIIEAANDLNSDSDLDMIQTQIASLLQEVNKIAADAKFNGVALLNGSLDNSSSTSPSVQVVQSPALPDGSQPTGSNVVNFDGLGDSGTLVGSYTYAGGTDFGSATIPTVGSINAYVSIQVTGYSANAIDPDSGMAVGAADYVTITSYSTDPNMGVAPVYTDTTAVNVNSGVITNIQWGPPGTGAGNVLLDFSLANLTAQDVGASMTFETSTPGTTSASSGTPLSVNTTGTEGGDVHIELPSVSTSALNISNISVMSSDVENYLDQVTGTTNNQAATSDAQWRVQAALDTISGVRATVGAQAVSLREDANDASIQVVNQTASMSAIRDLDVGQAVTQFTKDQIMTQIGTSVLAQMHANAQLVIQLVNGVNPGINGKV